MDKFFEILRAVALFVAYLFGKRDAEVRMEAKTNEAALVEATRALKKREEIKNRYRNVRAATPNNWDELRKKNSGTGA